MKLELGVGNEEGLPLGVGVREGVAEGVGEGVGSTVLKQNCATISRLSSNES